jgi:large subunit ribosomal protein L17
MRHKVYGHRLGRDSSHRKALRKNLIANLICNEQIVTTEAKARMLRPAAEKMITLAKRGLVKGIEDPMGEVYARRRAASSLPKYLTVEDEDGMVEDIDVVHKLFGDIAPRYADRPGGYTRMIKIGKRPGDNADMAILMLVEEE